MKRVVAAPGLQSLPLILGVLLSGCASDPMPVVRARAASDLRCGEASLVVTRPPQADSAIDNDYPFMVQGCGEIGRYVVSYCHGLAGCTVTNGQVVSKTARRQAAFDLQCAESEITLQLLGRDTLGARGCGRQASYSLVKCDAPAIDVSGACEVVQSAAPTARTSK